MPVRPYREIAVEDEETGFSGYLVVDATDTELSFGGTRIAFVTAISA